MPAPTDPTDPEPTGTPDPVGAPPRATARTRAAVRPPFAQHLVAVRALLVLTLVTGVAYPAAVTLVAHVPGLAAQADGSLVTDATGRVVGSSLIGQAFTDADGEPLAQWFQSRPSAAGDGYDAMASGGSNLGPSSTDLAATVQTRREAVAAFDSVPGHTVDPADVPADAVTASASGLDPHISPAYARQQARRVALARGLDADTVLDLVAECTQGRVLGLFGEPRVDVVTLNLALQALDA